MPDASGGLSDEDQKLVTLAQGARARGGASAGAAVRDETGRTYAGASVTMKALSISALALAVAQAVAAGARSLEAAAVVSQADPTSDDLRIASELGGDRLRVIVADRDGTVRGLVHPEGGA